MSGEKFGIFNATKSRAQKRQDGGSVMSHAIKNEPTLAQLLFLTGVLLVLLGGIFGCSSLPNRVKNLEIVVLHNMQIQKDIISEVKELKSLVNPF